MLHKALLRNRLKTTEELEDEQEEENKKEYFYVKKKEFFEDLLIEQYWNWQADYDSKTIEDKYFNWDDLWDATYNAQNAEEYYLAQGKLINYNYLRHMISLWCQMNLLCSTSTLCVLLLLLLEYLQDLQTQCPAKTLFCQSKLWLQIWHPRGFPQGTAKWK